MQGQNILTNYWHSWSAVRSGQLIKVFQSVPLIGAIFFWLISLKSVDLSKMTDLGLVSVLPPAVFVAYGLILAGFVVHLFGSRPDDKLLYLYLIVLVLMIHATPQILYGTLRYSWAWKHVGIVDYILRHGAVDPHISVLGVYHNWPGFFALNALLTQSAGFQSALDYAGWAPAFFNVLFLSAIVILFRTLTDDQRLVWLGAWLFVLANWVGQDYFAPQAAAFFLFLIVLAITLKWFKTRGNPYHLPQRIAKLANRLPLFLQRIFDHQILSDHEDQPASLLQRRGVWIVTVVLIAAMVSIHQLTPFMLVSSLGILVFFRRITSRNLLWITILFTLAWFVLVAGDYMADDIKGLLAGVGKVSSNTTSGFMDLAMLSSGQKLVSFMGRGLSLLIWLLAFLGIIQRLIHKKFDFTALLLLAAPLLTVVLGSYGGEILFRVYFFSLPLAAFFAGALFLPEKWKKSAYRSPLVSYAVGLVLLVGLFFAYYGKEQQYYFTKGEVQAAEFLYSSASPNSLLIEGSRNYPSQFLNYENFTYVPLDREPEDSVQKVIDRPARELTRWMVNPSYSGTYLIITRSQKALTHAVGSMPPGALDKIEESLRNSPNFKIIFSNPDAVIFTLKEDQ